MELVEEHHHHSADMKSRSSGLDEEPSPVKSQSSRALPVMKGVFPRGAPALPKRPVLPERPRELPRRADLLGPRAYHLPSADICIKLSTRVSSCSILSRSAFEIENLPSAQSSSSSPASSGSLASTEDWRASTYSGPIGLRRALRTSSIISRKYSTRLTPCHDLSLTATISSYVIRLGTTESVNICANVFLAISGNCCACACLMISLYGIGPTEPLFPSNCLVRRTSESSAAVALEKSPFCARARILCVSSTSSMIRPNPGNCSWMSSASEA
mmetsp:Transcript_85458/g.125059  ORF Transcript_85458/g.125059 Transcript_85458/m.125059 type:complete len:272 (-) Transcript_85458:1338-2153(-)